MANRTLVPALRAHVGDWDYYVAVMKYATVASTVNFAYELGGNQDLNSMIQRGLSARTKEITEYLEKSPHRFLGALIIACWGGNPEYTSVEMSDPDGLLRDLDEDFGILVFDGTQQFFALDGQHRLRAIKDAIKKDPEIGKEDIAVLIVSHFETDKGKERTRRLFTNINRNAKTTTAAENIALDEDNGYAILTRRMLTDHDFLSQDGVVRVFTRVDPDTGEVKLATKTVPVGDKTALTTIATLYQVLEFIGKDLDPNANLTQRPSDELLEERYKELAGRIDSLLEHCGNVRERLEDAANAKEVRSPKGNESAGHAMMRPVVQLAVSRVVKSLLAQGMSWQDIMDRLNDLNWELGEAPWLAVWSPNQKKMLVGKDNQDLLLELLHVHLAPASRQRIKAARRDFKDIRGTSYPVTEEQLAIRLS